MLLKLVLITGNTIVFIITALQCCSVEGVTPRVVVSRDRVTLKVQEGASAKGSEAVCRTLQDTSRRSGSWVTLAFIL